MKKLRLIALLLALCLVLPGMAMAEDTNQTNQQPYAVYDENGNILTFDSWEAYVETWPVAGTYTTDRAGKIDLSHLKGSIVVTEEKAPVGYTRDETVYAMSKPSRLTVVNRRGGGGGAFVIQKQDKDGKPLPAQVKIYGRPQVGNAFLTVTKEYDVTLYENRGTSVNPKWFAVEDGKWNEVLGVPTVTLYRMDATTGTAEMVGRYWPNADDPSTLTATFELQEGEYRLVEELNNTYARWGRYKSPAGVYYPASVTLLVRRDPATGTLKVNMSSATLGVARVWKNSNYGSYTSVAYTRSSSALVEFNDEGAPYEYALTLKNVVDEEPENNVPSDWK